MSSHLEIWKPSGRELVPLSGQRVTLGKASTNAVSLEHDPAKCEEWRRNVADAGLEEWAELVEDDAHATLQATQDVFDIVFLDAEKDDYEALFALARPLLEPGGLVLADNVRSHADTLGAYSAARQADRSLSSVTVPLDRGLELSVILTDVADLGLPAIRSECVCSRYRGKEVVRLE